MGRLVKTREGLQLQYPPTAHGANLEEYFFDESTARVCSVSSGMSYPQVCRGVAKTVSEIKFGNKLIGNNKPLFALTVVPDKERSTDTFAIVLSISHVIVDGFCYYQILNMLNENAPLLKLSCIRKHSIMEVSKKSSE